MSGSVGMLVLVLLGALVVVGLVVAAIRKGSRTGPDRDRPADTSGEVSLYASTGILAASDNAATVDSAACDTGSWDAGDGSDAGSCDTGGGNSGGGGDGGGGGD